MLYKDTVSMSSVESVEKIDTLIHRLKHANRMSVEKIDTPDTTHRHSGGESSSVGGSPSGGPRRHYSPRSKIDTVEIDTRGKSPSGKKADYGREPGRVSTRVSIVSSVEQGELRVWFRALVGYWVEERGVVVNAFG